MSTPSAFTRAARGAAETSDGREVGDRPVLIRLVEVTARSDRAHVRIEGQRIGWPEIWTCVAASNLPVRRFRRLRRWIDRAGSGSRCAGWTRVRDHHREGYGDQNRSPPSPQPDGTKHLRRDHHQKRGIDQLVPASRTASRPGTKLRPVSAQKARAAVIGTAIQRDGRPPRRIQTPCNRGQYQKHLTLQKAVWPVIQSP